MVNNVKVHGYCDPRFSSVREVFLSNLESGDDIGASFAATIDGEFVVDIWGGYANPARTRLWHRDTIVNVYSTTKVMTALCMLMLVDRGLLDLDAPVAKYWPEFAQAGKEKIPVRYLLSHQSGLPGWDVPIPVETLYDWNRSVSLLAAQKPWWVPGKHSGYHSFTFGHLLGEVLRRITHKSLGTFFKDEVAIPLNADFHIGLPEAYDCRVGELCPPPILKPGDAGYVSPPAPGTILFRIGSNPIIPATKSQDRAWRAAEIPAANGHGNARSVARVASIFACGGELDGIRLLTKPTIEKAIEEQCYGLDLAFGIPIRWGLGFALPSKEVPLYRNPRSFFWGGWGGSHIGVDLDGHLSFSYVMNRMVNGTLGDKRSGDLIRAIFNSI